MPKVITSRSIQINAPMSKVHGIINDFKQWPTWSPWLITEPDAKVVYADDGNQYEWEGKRVGAGEMKKANISERLLKFDLTFLKPWKSTSATSFNLQETDGGTNVTWTMNSSLPFYMFWMKKMMEAWIGMDYDRGLKMLKEYAETGQINSQLEFLGEQEFAGCTYVGIKRKVDMDKIGEVMEKDYSELIGAAMSNENATGEMFTQYSKWQMVKKSVTYTACVGVKEVPKDIPGHWEVGTLPPGKMQTVRHNGPYTHVGNAWSAIQSMMRNKEYRANKKYPPMEFYRNSPKEVEPEELISDVCFLTK